MTDKNKLAEETNKVLQASRQPKNKTKVNPDTFFASTFRWVKKQELFEPDYSVYSCTRDQWLRTMYKTEPHLAGVLSTAVSLDANRGYSLVGGRNQVARFSRVLRDVENGLGWRTHKQLGAQDYYSTDINQIVEIETDGRNGPLVSLYHVDSARCELTGKYDLPLKYEPYNGKESYWKPEWFYRASSMPSPDEQFNRLGYCAVSRCWKIAQIMIAVIEHDIEKLSKLAPKGLLTIESDDITQESWDRAWEQHQQVYTGKTGNEYFDEMVVLVARAIKANVTAFSEMPDRFDPFKFTDYMMKAYALAFNLPTRFFWDIGGGSFGDVGEVSIQSDRATQTGLANYMLADQEQIQRLLPDSVLFLYEEDDTAGKIQKAELLQVWGEAGKNLVELGMSTQSFLAMMVKEGIIDPEFTPDVEEEIATDDEGVLQYRRQQLIEKEYVQQAVKKFPDDPIVEYKWPDEKYIQLWKKGSDAIKKYYQFTVEYTKPKGSRQQRVIQQTNKFADIVQLGIDKRIDKDELQTRLVNYQLAGMVVKYYDESTTRTNRTTLEQDTYNAANSFLENEALLEDEPIENNAEAQSQIDAFDLALLALLLPSRVQEQFETIYLYGLDSDFFEQIEDGYFEDHDLDYRINLWSNALLTGAMLGYLFMRGTEQDLAIWNRSNVDSCETCLTMEGTIRTKEEWQQSAILPRIGTICNGSCQCSIQDI